MNSRPVLSFGPAFTTGRLINFGRHIQKNDKSCIITKMMVSNSKIESTGLQIQVIYKSYFL